MFKNTITLLFAVLLSSASLSMASELKIQSIGKKIWKVNTPSNPRVIFDINNFQSKYSIMLVPIVAFDGVDTFFDEIKKETNRDSLGITAFMRAATDIKNSPSIFLFIEYPKDLEEDIRRFFPKMLIAKVSKTPNEDTLQTIADYKTTIKKMIDSCSKTTLWDFINNKVYNTPTMSNIVPLLQKQLADLETSQMNDFNHAISDIQKGAAYGTIIGDMDDSLVQEWAAWAENFAGNPNVNTAETKKSPHRNFDGKTYYFNNKSLANKHNVVMLLPMLNVDSPFYAHSLILKELLMPSLTQGQGGQLYGALRYSAKPLYVWWNRDLALNFECNDRETSIHIRSLRNKLMTLQKVGITEDQFNKAKEHALAFADYFKTNSEMVEQFVHMLRATTPSAEKANEIVSEIERTLKTLTYETFNASLSSFYSPEAATFFFEGEVNTIGGIEN